MEYATYGEGVDGGAFVYDVGGGGGHDGVAFGDYDGGTHVGGGGV